MTDVLDPERPLFCICECPSPFAAEVLEPSDICTDKACACHAVYWMTVPENEKRAMWGDR